MSSKRDEVDQIDLGGALFSKLRPGLSTLLLGGMVVVSLFWLVVSQFVPTGEENLIVYLAMDENGVFQLAQITTDGTGEPFFLTDHRFNVQDYAIEPNGRRIVYSVAEEERRSDLWVIDRDGSGNRQVLACKDAVCRGAVWSPTADRLLYERRDLFAPDEEAEPPRLWWLDLGQGTTVPLSEDRDLTGWGAQFSPDGQWVSWAIPLAEEVVAYHFETGETAVFKSGAGEPPFWGIDGGFYFTAVELQGESVAIHVFRGDLETGEIFDMSGADAAVNDGGLAWSPRGDVIAFTRKPSRAPSGKQLWLMAHDGGNQRSLTQTADIHHGPPQWSADGTQLIYQVYDSGTLNAVPAVWRMVAATGEQQKLTDGIRPSWLDR